jgi:hypothetical protein
VSTSDRFPDADGAPAWREFAWRGILLAASVDAVIFGIWSTDPARLFAYLGMEPRHDTRAWQLPVPRSEIPAPRDAGLWHLLALFSYAHVALLALATWRPRSLGGLAVVPLIGHAIGAALWLWALGTTYDFSGERLPFPHRRPLAVLTVHDAVLVAMLLAFLLFGPPRTGRHSQEKSAGVQ